MLTQPVFEDYDLSVLPTTNPGSNKPWRAAGGSGWQIVVGAYVASAGVTDHGNLSGLLDDDHPQYVKKSGDTMSGPLTVNGLVIGPGNASLSSPAANTITFPNGIQLDINGTPRFFSPATLTFQCNSTTKQHMFANEIGGSLTGTLLELSGGGAGAATGAKLLNLTNAFASVASIDKDGDIVGRGLSLVGPALLAPFTFATVPSASANAGATIRITDRGHRLATSNGTNWCWAGSTTIIS